MPHVDPAATVTGEVHDDALVRGDARIEGLVGHRACVVGPAIIAPTGVVTQDAYVGGTSTVAGVVTERARVIGGTVPDGASIYGGTVDWDITLPVLSGTFQDYGWVISNGVLNFGCETHTVEEWELLLDDLCREWAKDEWRTYAAFIRGIIEAYKHA